MPVSEKEIAAGSQAPRVSQGGIDLLAAQAKKWVQLVPGTTVTICALTVANEFTVIGTSACASPENFKADIGERLAFENAKNKLWDLEGYLLRSRLAVR